MDLVSLRDRQIKTNYSQRVWLGYAEGRVEAGDEVGHLVEGDKLSGVRVKPTEEII